MGGWNTDSGASLHCELIGREFVRQKHKLKAFTFYEHAFHGTQITGEDEDYVIRCFTHSRFNPIELDAKPFITTNYDLFIAEDIGMLPKNELGKIFDTHINKKAKTVSVYHDNQLSSDPGFYQFDWDAIVCFDQRYKNVLLQAFPDEKIHIIPYPSLSYENSDKIKMRNELNLPEDKKIIFTFGLNSNRVLELISELDQIYKNYPTLVVVLTRDPKIIFEYKKLQKKMKIDMIIREEAPSIKRLYKYLNASDLLLYYRIPTPHIVVASTILQCLGAGCPILGNETRYTEIFEDEIFKYSNTKELVKAIEHVFNQDEEYKKVIKSAKSYVDKTSAKEVSKQFLELYRKL